MSLLPCVVRMSRSREVTFSGSDTYVPTGCETEVRRRLERVRGFKNSVDKGIWLSRYRCMTNVRVIWSLVMPVLLYSSQILYPTSRCSGRLRSDDLLHAMSGNVRSGSPAMWPGSLESLLPRAFFLCKTSWREESGLTHEWHVDATGSSWQHENWDGLGVCLWYGHRPALVERWMQRGCFVVCPYIWSDLSWTKRTAENRSYTIATEKHAKPIQNGSAINVTIKTMRTRDRNMLTVSCLGNKTICNQ